MRLFVIYILATRTFITTQWTYHNMPNLGQNRPDAASIGPILAQFRHTVACLQGPFFNNREYLLNGPVKTASITVKEENKIDVYHIHSSVTFLWSFIMSTKWLSPPLPPPPPPQKKLNSLFIGSGNGLSPDHHQAITWTNTDMLSSRS